MYLGREGHWGFRLQMKIFSLLCLLLLVMFPSRGVVARLGRVSGCGLRGRRRGFGRSIPFESDFGFSIVFVCAQASKPGGNGLGIVEELPLGLLEVN